MERVPAGESVRVTAQSGGVSEKRHWIRLTWVCNQRCLFCLDRDAQDGSVRDFEDVRRDLTEGRALGLTRVVLSGGEPTVHPRFIEIVAMARALGYTHVQAITNGRRMCYPEFFEGVVGAGLGELTFSMHGHTPALHDRLTRVPGSFIQALSGLRRALARRGLIVSVDVVITRLNLSVLRELLDFYVGLGVREFDLLALVPFGDAWRNLDELYCDFSLPENGAALRKALELSRTPGLHLWTNRLRPEHMEGYESLIQPPEKILDEVRGRKRLFTRYLETGRPMPCSGTQCRYCFLEGFCADVAELLERGGLSGRKGPACGKPSAGEEAFSSGPDVDIFAFAEYYIAHRYFVKGSACRTCHSAAACDGMSVARVRKEGFKSMAPAASPGGPRG